MMALIDVLLGHLAAARDVLEDMQGDDVDAVDDGLVAMIGDDLEWAVRHLQRMRRRWQAERSDTALCCAKCGSRLDVGADVEAGALTFCFHCGALLTVTNEVRLEPADLDALALEQGQREAVDEIVLVLRTELGKFG